MIYNYEQLIDDVIKQLGEETDKNVIPLINVLTKVHSRLIDSNFQYATFLILNNDLARLVETDQYPILSKYDSHDQDYIKTAFCVCLNKQISEINNPKKICNNNKG